jgi:CHAD domain-containing protein
MTISETDLSAFTFRSYGAHVIRQALAKMLSHTEGVREGSDIEAVHDMRVASRRLRAALSVFGRAFECKEFERFERDVKAVTQELGAARDLDVMIDTLEKMESTLAPSEQAGVDSFVQEKRALRAKMQREVVNALERMEKRDLATQFEAIVDKVTVLEPALSPFELNPLASPGETVASPN